MIPILSQTTTLTGYGLGSLSDALSCTVTHEINGEYELRMTYPITGEWYKTLAEDLIVWAEPDNLTAKQAFRIYRITRPLNGIVTVYAHHVAYDMSGIIVKPFTATTLQTALTALPSNCSPSCPFSFTTTRAVTADMKVTVPTPLWALLGGQAGSFLDVYGGEWDFDNLTAELKTTLGTDRGVTVRYGKNLTKLEQDVSIEATYAGVFPFWYDEESGTLVKLSTDYISIPGATGSRLLLLDLSDEWDTAPTTAQLTTRTNAYITANDPGTPKISWKVNMAMLGQSAEFADQALLEQVMLGDTVHVYYEPMNLTASARAVKTEYNVLLERYENITLGRVKQNMAQIVAAEKKETQQTFKTMKSSLEKAIEESTDFIKNGGGYMRFIYDANDNLTEIVSLDDPDIAQATNVWRWNNGGFGFSNTGYSGTYGLAITQNGAIVADFITAGTMAGNRVRTGLLEDETGTNYWNLDTGEFHLEALGDFGGRNLIQNTLEPSVASAADYPKIVGGQDSTVGGTASTATHGIRTTAASNGAWLQIGFGGASGMNGLIAGRTYTFSCDLECKMLSGLTSGSYNLTLWTYVNGSNDTNYRIVAIDTTNSGTVIKMPVSITFTVPSNATAFRFFIRCQSSSATFALTNDYIEIANIKLERGSVATAWSPAPEDQVGNDEIISKINVSPEVVQIQASKISLAGKTIDLTSDTIAITSTNFSVDSAGVITATGANISGSFTMTGGSINITTATDSTDAIELNYGTAKIRLNPSRFDLSNTNGLFGNYAIVLRNDMGTVGVYDAVNTSTTFFNMTAHTGTLALRGATTPGAIDLKDTSNNNTVILSGGNGFGGISKVGLVMGDGTHTLTDLDTTGLTFKNTSGTVTATYPATSSELSPTYTTNSYCSSTSVGRVWITQQGSFGAMHFNLSIDSTALTNSAGEVEIMRFSGITLKQAAFFNIPSQSGNSTILMTVSKAGIVKIYTAYGSASGFYRAEVPLLFA